MRRVTTLLRGVGLGLLALWPVAGALPVSALDTAPVLIVALQTQGSADQGGASAEFVELYNHSGQTVSLDKWRLQYQSATGTTWTTRATLAGTLAAGKGTLLATQEFPASQQTALPRQPLNSGMAIAGGHVQLLAADNAVQDLVGWGTAAHANTSAAPAPSAGQQLRRNVSSAGQYVDTNNDRADFAIFGAGATSGTTANTPDDSTTPAVRTLAGAGNDSLQITELLANPASPATDANDEFIELYNPDSVIIQLAGYTLQTGDTFSHSFKLSDGTIGPGEYLAIYSRDSKLSLSNTSGKARLLAADGSTVSETGRYESAANNASWSQTGGAWQWAAQPTPGAANAVPAPAVSKKTSSKSSATSSAAKTSSKTSGKVAGTSTTKATGKNSAVSANASAAGRHSAAPVHPLVLAGIGGMAVAYALYEYRHDLANRLFQLRSYLAARRSHRAKV